MATGRGPWPPCGAAVPVAPGFDPRAWRGHFCLVAFLDHTLGRWTILRRGAWPSGAGKIILTFDDGPSPHSDELLGVLERHSVRAAFCWIGRNAAARPGTVRRAFACGHLLVSHTETHRLPLLSAAAFDRELRAADRSFGLALGDPHFRSSWFRPPFGLLPPAVLSSPEAEARRVAFLTRYEPDPSAGTRSWQRVLRRLREGLLRDGGGAVVLHEMRYPFVKPSKGWLPEAVNGFIAWARAEGFEFALYNDTPGIPAGAPRGSGPPAEAGFEPGL